MIDAIAFKGEGCAFSIAAASMLSEKVKGISAAAVAALEKKEIIALLGIPLTVSRIKCGTLGLVTLQSVLKKSIQI